MRPSTRGPGPHERYIGSDPRESDFPQSTGQNQRRARISLRFVLTRYRIRFGVALYLLG
jgi:hypothetical protein